MLRRIALAVLALSSLATALAAKPKTSGATPYVMPLTGDLGRQGLLAIPARRLTFKRRDAFSPALDESALVGRTFRVTRPFLPTDDDGPTWAYDLQHQSLSLTLRPDYETADFGGALKDSIAGVVLMRSSNLVGSRIGQNAFGVKARIKTYRDVVVVLGGLEDTLGNSEGDGEALKSLDTLLPEPPGKARDIAAKGYAVFYGALTTVADKAVSACGSSQSEATINDPIETFGEYCVVGARFDGVEFYAPDGELLWQWHRPPPPPPKPPLGTVVWEKQPSADDVARYYPERAQRMGVAGQVTMSCEPYALGNVGNCTVISESPPDQEFGSAAVKLSYLFKLDLAKSNAPPGTLVTVPVAFVLPKD